MTDATTTNYGWTKPTVGADGNTWGGLLNSDLDSIDTDLFAVSGVANAALPKAGGTVTGSLTVDAGITSTGDVTVQRSGSPTNGLIFFGNTGTHYIYFDGTNFTVAGTGILYAPAGGFNGPLAGDVTGNVSGSSGSCTGNAVTATTATNATNATTAASCSGNAATATSATTAKNLTDGTSGPNKILWDDTYAHWVFYVRGTAVAVVDSTGVRNLV